MMMLSNSLLVVFALCSLRGACDQVEVDLTGSSWVVSDTLGKYKNVPATVPGQVHLDLMKAGHIGDPYDGWNDWLLQWIPHSNWMYARSFSLPDVTGRMVYLKVDGLDTVASISVDGGMAGEARNMHRTHYFDITNLLQGSDQHTLLVTLNASANYSANMAASYPYNLTEGGIGDFFNGSHRNFVRKTQSDFGWDWGPAFVPSGITRNISVLLTSGVYVTHITPKTFYRDGYYGVSVTVCAMVTASVGEITLYINYTLSFPDIGIYEDRYNIVPSTQESCVTTSTEVSPSKIEPDHLWWPNGVRWMKSSPTLSQVTASINITKKTSSDVLWKYSVTKNVGFRRIELIQEPAGNGKTFFFQLTTDSAVYPIFAKGSNFIPMDAFVNRATPQSARRLLTSAVNGNQNMIRVWGGGLYQPDWFYDLCDELGLMVWQEFMFADALYPRDKDFLAEVELEVRDVVRRLGNHPSIVLWSGNNENQDLAQGDPGHLVDYSALYDSIVRATLWEEDTTRLYWPSSPSNGVLVDDSERELFIQRWGDTSSPDYGDVHRYDYSDLCTDVSKFPKPRFASEFGFQSYPTFGSLAKISKKEDWSNLSPLMLHRQHHPQGNQEMDSQMRLLFHPPNNTDKSVQFQDFVYLSQIVQGVCIQSEAEHYRRYISNDTVMTRGTLYWQLNDIWQAPSWASLEWSGQWKILHHYMSAVYKQLSVSTVAEDDGIGIHVIVDTANHDVKYDLLVQVITWKNGDVVHQSTKNGRTAKGFTGERVWFEKSEDIFSGTSVQESFLYYTVNGEDASITGWFFPANFSSVSLEEASIKTSDFKLALPTKVTFTVKSSAVAPYVYLESRNYPGRFSDNGFLLLNKSPVGLFFETWQTIDMDTFTRGLKIRSLHDTYSNKPYQDYSETLNS